MGKYNCYDSWASYTYNDNNVISLTIDKTFSRQIIFLLLCKDIR